MRINFLPPFRGTAFQAVSEHGQAARATRGMALVTAMIALLAISAAAFYLCSETATENNTTDRIRLSAIADAMAESGAAYATRMLSNYFAIGMLPTTIPLPLAPLSIENGTVNFTISYMSGYQRNELFTPANNPQWAPNTASTPGLQRLVYPFSLMAVATYTNPNSNRVYYGIVNEVIEIRCEPIFQYLAFWGNTSPFEVLPGANMTLTGAIFSNRDMYIGPSGGSPPATSTTNQIFDTNYLYTAGQFHYARLDGNYGDDNANGGTLAILKMGANGSAYPTNYVTVPSYITLQSAGVPTGASSVNIDGMDSSFAGYTAKSEPSFAAFASTNLGGTLQTAAVGNIQPLSLPAVNSLNSFVPATNGATPNFALNTTTGLYVSATPPTATSVIGPYVQSAKLLIKYSKSAGVSQAYDNTNPAHPVLLTGSTGNDAALPSKTTSGVTTTTVSDVNGKMYDARQGSNVNLTQIDLSLLSSDPRFQPGGYFDPNSIGVIIYAYREDTLATLTVPNAANDSNGIRLVNGSQLSNAMTLVTEDPLYVEGNFNSGTTWHPVALMADAINLLSSAWNDSKTAANASTLPAAATTTYNFAMLSGIVPSVAGGAYSGGLENFPRFHEDWSNATANYTGSFVNLMNSVYANGAWFCGAPVYNPPTRNYNFDTRFLTTSNLPPGTLTVAGTAQVVYWQLASDW